MREDGAIRRGAAAGEAVDELVEDGFEAGIVVVQVGSNDVDDFAVAVGRLSMISSGLVDHAEAIPAVVHVGEAFEEVASGALGLVELALVDEVDCGVGQVPENQVSAPQNGKDCIFRRTCLPAAQKNLDKPLRYIPFSDRPSF